MPYIVTVAMWLVALGTAWLPPYWLSVLGLAVAGYCMAQDVEDMPLWLRLLLWDIPVWLLYASVALVLDIIGLVLIALLSAWHAWDPRPSAYYAEPGLPNASRQVYAWAGGCLTWLWGNEEDGVLGPVWWQNRTQAELGYWRRAWSAYRWSALRNPSNNLRFVPGINPVIEPSRIQGWQGRVGPMFCWYVRQGAFAGLWAWVDIKGQTFRFLIGWKLQVTDANGVADTDYRKPRCGFGVQFKRMSP